MADVGSLDVDGTVQALTLEQKVALTSGADLWHLEAIPQHGVEPIKVADGPHGLRTLPDGADQMTFGQSVPATCFPPAVALASSWDTELVREVGVALGREARAEGVSVLLGPGVNIKRSLLCGRNFEYFSEDPLLAGRMGAAWVDGVQSQGVGASLKHFAAYNQETDLHRVSADVDERTLREIYLAAFEHVVTVAQPLTVMGAYNKVNGTYACEHRWLLTEVLRREWGFTGLVLSDWGGVSDRVAALRAGLDLEMPPSPTDGVVLQAVADGGLEESRVDEAARRVLRLVASTAGGRAAGRPYDADAHHDLARRAAAAGTVLLKNEGGLLPFDPQGTDRIAVIGELARTPRFQGAGSSAVTPSRLENALDALVAEAGDRVAFAPGFTLDGEPSHELVEGAVRCASSADLVVLFLGIPPGIESEGFDRRSIDLPADQVALLDAVHAVNQRTVVVLANGGVVSVHPWQDQAAALVEGWLSGQAGGPAITDVLFGRVEPSGRLAETIPLRIEDSPAYLLFPGAEQHVRYGEGVYVGYRYYDTLKRPVAYPFGFGLSYTSFELAAVEVEVALAGDEVTVAADVVNTGARAGSQVVQVYVHDVESSVDRPAQELKSFAKVHLEPGCSATVEMRLDRRAVSFWSVAEQRWKFEAGQVEIRVGFSSRDIRACCTVDMAGDGIPAPLGISSTLDEWLANPVVGPALHAVVSSRATPKLLEMLGQMPMTVLANFGIGPSRQQLAELVDAYQRAVGPTQPAPGPAAQGETLAPMGHLGT